MLDVILRQADINIFIEEIGCAAFPNEYNTLVLSKIVSAVSLYKDKFYFLLLIQRS